MIIEKNRHLEAATSLMGNRPQGKVLLQSLTERPNGSFQFIAPKKTLHQIAMLILHNPGASATFLATPPKSNDEIEAIQELIQEGLIAVRTPGISLVQTVMGTHEPLLEQAFKYAGFSKLATLTYMEQTRPPKQIRLQQGIQFTQLSQQHDNILGQLLEETYVDSLDCPAIHGARKVQDIIDGHRGTDKQSAQVWSIAELGGVPTGVILLNTIPKSNRIELAYIGIAPRARGRGLSHSLMQHAVHQARKHNCTKITLAVDATNGPAIGLYKKWNFIEKHKRLTLIHKLSTVC